MNIFAVSSSTLECAQMLDDRRLVKMVLETVQLLSTAARINMYVVPELQHILYKPNHVNHPCSIWARANLNNYIWLYQLFNALNSEYMHRYGRIHKSWQTLYGVLSQNVGYTDPPATFPNCTPYKDTPVFEAYRRYMNDKWAKDGPLARWTNRNPPNWKELKEPLQ